MDDSELFADALDKFISGASQSHEHFLSYYAVESTKEVALEFFKIYQTLIKGLEHMAVYLEQGTTESTERDEVS